MSRKEKEEQQRKALLKGVIDRAREQADDFIDKLAHQVKADAPDQPIESIRLLLTRGDHCKCVAALRLLETQ